MGKDSRASSFIVGSFHLAESGGRVWRFCSHGSPDGEDGGPGMGSHPSQDKEWSVAEQARHSGGGGMLFSISLVGSEAGDEEGVNWQPFEGRIQGGGQG